MTVSLPVVLVSALYLFDAALLSLPRSRIGITFPLLTVIYVLSVLELSVLLPFVARRLRVCYLYSPEQFP